MISTSTPDAVLVEHEGLVRSAVGWALRRIGGTQCVIDGDDLAQHARLSLLKAHAEFNGRGNFEPYATQRIQWALLDVIRDVGPMGRKHWRQMKAGLRPQIFHKSIDGNGHGCFQDSGFDLPAPATAEPFTGVDHRKLRVLAEQLPARSRTIVIEYYWNGRTMREIGLMLGVKESRVSQLHKRALEQFRPIARGEHLAPPRDRQPQTATIATSDIVASLQRLTKSSESDAKRLTRIEERVVTLEDQLNKHFAWPYGDTVSIVQAMKICGVARRTIYNWIDQKKVRYARTPGGAVRIARASLLRVEREGDGEETSQG